MTTRRLLAAALASVTLATTAASADEPQAAKAGDLALTAHVVGTDGKPVAKSSILFWRAVGPDEPPRDGDWKDAATGRIWRGVGGAATGDSMTTDRLVSGVYRATARFGHDSSGPAGVSDPVTLDGSEKSVDVTVRLAGGSTLTVRPVDAATGDLLADASVSVAPAGDRFPPGWRFRATRGANPPRFDDLPPGEYVVSAGKRAFAPDEREYEAGGEPALARVGEDAAAEVTVPLRGRPLTNEEVTGRWPWIVTGRVTDGAGGPIADVEVIVHAGIGTLRRTGTGRTDADGRYAVRFAPGIWYVSDDEHPRGQIASVTFRKDRLTERSRTVPGVLWALDRKPADPKAIAAEAFAEPAQIVLPGEPFTLDATLVEAARLGGALLNADGTPAANRSLSLWGVPSGEEPQSLASVPTDGEGRFTLDGVLPQADRWFVVSADRRTVRSLPVRLPRSGAYELTLRLGEEQGIPLLTVSNVRTADGVAVPDALGDDPSARPPLPPADQERGRDILRRMAEANAPWLTAPPAAAKTWSYEFVLPKGERKAYSVAEDRRVPGVVLHGIAFVSTLHHLAEHPEGAVFRRIDAGLDRIELTYVFREPAAMSAGNGVLGSYAGFFSGRAEGGRLVLDAKTLAPLENETSRSRETFGRFVEVAPDRVAPLAVRVEGNGVYDWSFRVYEPGLWLFRDAKDRDGAVRASVENVRVNGKAGVVGKE